MALLKFTTTFFIHYIKPSRKARKKLIKRGG